MTCSILLYSECDSGAILWSMQVCMYMPALHSNTTEQNLLAYKNNYIFAMDCFFLRCVLQKSVGIFEIPILSCTVLYAVLM